MSGAQRRVLLIYSRVGGGHLSAARALAEELEATGRVRTRLADVYLEAGRFPVTLFPKAYADLARHHPRLWSLVFHTSNSALDPRRPLGLFLRAGLQRLRHEEQPHLAISVLPMVNGLLAEVFQRTEVVLTDWHSVHRFWEGPGVAHYTAPTESARQDCVRFGAPASVVDVVGIPVRRAFARLGERRPNQRLTVLVMVGAEGSPRALDNVRELLRAGLDAQVVVVCGRNEALRQRVAALPSRLPVQALGFVENVPELMRSADILVTKAGGLTLAEAFCCAVPVVVYDVLPGQEAGNLAYALSHDAVAHSTTPRDLVELVRQLAAAPARRAELAQRGHRLARPDAAEQIVSNVLARLDAAGA